MHHRSRMTHWHMDHYVRSELTQVAERAVVTSGLDQQDGPRWVSRQAVGENATSRPRSYNDVVSNQ
jgi:hypothetical protein